MHHILVLGAGKSATILIESLLEEAHEHDWYVHVADVQLETAQKRSRATGDQQPIAWSQGNRGSSTN
jgi:pyrroline-5-carboxylate reductase